MSGLPLLKSCLLQGGDRIKLNDILSRITESDRISVEDPDSAPELLVDAVIRGNKLFFDGTTPVIRMILHYQRISRNEALAFICGHLDDKSQIIVPNRHIEEALKRLQYMARRQIDLSADFWKAQMYVNLSCGIYDILQQKLVPVHGEFKFDYVVDIKYRPHSTLEDAPRFKEYVETSVGMDQYQCLMRTLGYTLSGLTKARKACIMLGRPKSGKSTILDLLESVLKGDLVSHEPFDRMGTERAKAKYIGRKVNISREISTKLNKNAESFKSLISNERTTGEEKYEVQKSFIPVLFFIFAGNVDIEFAKECMDDAVVDRLYYIIYDKEIPDEKIDLDLDKKAAKGSYIETPVILAMVLGLRRSEIIGITWDNVDFENRLIHIRQSVVNGDPSIMPKGTYKVIGKASGRRRRDIILKTMLKTDSSVRSFTMNDALYNYLRTLKAKQDVMPRETKAYMDFVCVNAVGSLITPDAITSQFRKLLDRNNLPHIKFHALRHSCISLLANNNAFSMKQIQDYAGHSDFLTTFNVYSHTDDSTKKTEMDYITSCFSDLFNTDKEE